MGVVWEALDTRLDRRIAVKMLPTELAGDWRRQLFEQEAKVIARLNHPGIVTIYSIEEHDGIEFLTMELVQGRTLAENIPEGGLPLDRFLDIAMPLADALHSAHRRGVIHGDLKPANIMVSDEGRTKILDFGLARLRDSESARQQDDTETGTQEGILTGSLPYLSPEKAEGLAFDHRSDLFSLGVILYQMISGVRPFQGSNVMMLLLSIIEKEPPPLGTINPDLPPELVRCIESCLNKDPEHRSQSAAEVLEQLSEISHELELSDLSRLQVFGLRKGVLSVVVAGLVIGTALLWPLVGGRASPELSIGRTRRLTHDAGEEAFPVLSPDGRLLAYVAGPPGERHLQVQRVDGGRAIRLTEGLGPGRTWEWPSWSPDGTRLLFSALGESSQVWTIPALGGAARLVLDLPDLYTCAAWSPAGGEFAYVQQGGIWLRGLDDEGQGRQLAGVDDAHFLAWSPDGSRIACVSGNRRFLTFGNIAPSSVRIVSVDSGAVVPVTDDKSMSMSPVWTPDSRHLLFLWDREGNRDLYQVAVAGDGKPRSEPRRLTTGLDAKSLSLAACGGTLAYSVSSRTANIWAVPYPQHGVTGRAAALPITSGLQIIEAFDVSQDGSWLVFDSNRNGNQDIFRMRLPDGDPEQLTSDPADDWGPTWSPDGRHIAFYSMRTGNRDIFVMSSEGLSPQQVTDTAVHERYPDWSPDGSQLVFDRPESATLWVVEVREHGIAGTPRQLPSTGSFLRAARWSPDGGRIACPTSDAIMLVSVTGGEPRILISRPDASVPVPWSVAWSPDGSILYYKSYSREQVPAIWELHLDEANELEPRQLVDLQVPAPMTVGPDFDFDGERFYFTLPQTEGDIWLAELLAE